MYQDTTDTKECLRIKADRLIQSTQTHTRTYFHSLIASVFCPAVGLTWLRITLTSLIYALLTVKQLWLSAPLQCTHTVWLMFVWLNSLGGNPGPLELTSPSHCFFSLVRWKSAASMEEHTQFYTCLCVWFHICVFLAWPAQALQLVLQDIDV